jgi:hypothetical protein
MAWRCFDCDLPDPYNGAGDGIGSCECPRCEDCGLPPRLCHCDEWDDDWGDSYDDPYDWTPCDKPGCTCQVPAMVTARTVLDEPSHEQIAAEKRRADV